MLLISVGELNRNKNHEIVIRALAELPNENVHYVVAGTGELHDYLIRLAENLGIREKVHLLGYRRDIYDLYKAADVYLLPSLREGLNVSLMEAMASGLPVICAKIRGNVDLVENMTGGLLCISNQISEYKNAISRLVENGKLRERFGKSNLCKIQNYDLCYIMELHKSIYENLERKYIDNNAFEI